MTSNPNPTSNPSSISTQLSLSKLDPFNPPASPYVAIREFKTPEGDSLFYTITGEYQVELIALNEFRLNSNYQDLVWDYLIDNDYDILLTDHAFGE